MKIWIVRLVGVLMICLGAFFVRRLDHVDPDERYFKILALFAIPMGLMLIMATFIKVFGA
ncbi:hypothetical protein [Anaerofustis butyriciformans]|uniref:hypothetical protein n=1 Tax=Anaerofustis TaxID=264995 RepID=UPI002E3718E5|nr:hypothetical protein [Anaerofustis sp. HA2171]